MEIREVDNEKVLVFPCGMWLSSDEEDGKLSRDLYPIRDPAAIKKFSREKKGYLVYVITKVLCIKIVSDRTLCKCLVKIKVDFCNQEPVAPY